MELLKEILIEILRKDKIAIDFNLPDCNLLEIVDSVCYKLLWNIKKIINDPVLDDFLAIEKIVGLFEKSNINFGTRHDFS